ncbi:MAG: hypothetical protein HC817_05240, partial [Saprospiraceae bacterium]|nr:hypothetical protein [Saprospiraceae bacterium]
DNQKGKELTCRLCGSYWMSCNHLESARSKNERLTSTDVPPTDNKVLDLFTAYKDKHLNTKTLSEISNKYSPDVSTFYFLQKLYQKPTNKEAHDLYLNYYDQIKAQDFNDTIDDLLKSYVVVFVPGLAYKEDTTTGADFARQRKLLTEKGVRNELIEIGEWDLVENNANLIAQRLKYLASVNEKILLVSASKGGLETAIALGTILTPEDIKSVKSWINVGGILRGSPIADNYLKFPKCWLAEVALWTKGKKINLVKNISYNDRQRAFDSITFPEHINIINFVGLPLSTRIDKKIKSRYCSMIKLGPNDGLSPIADLTVENGITISELGLDHYFRDDNIDVKTLALAMVAVKLDQNGK